MTTQSLQEKPQVQVPFLPPLLFLLIFLQCLIFAWDSGQTVDEAFYNGYGYRMLRYHNYKSLGEHPPFATQLGSLSLLLIQPRFPYTDPVLLNEAGGIDLAKTGLKFLYESGNNPQLILFLERLPIIFLTLLLAWTLYRWTDESLGKGAGILALSFVIGNTRPIFFSISMKWLARRDKGQSLSLIQISAEERITAGLPCMSRNTKFHS